MPLPRPQANRNSRSKSSRFSCIPQRKHDFRQTCKLPRRKLFWPRRPLHFESTPADRPPEGRSRAVTAERQHGPGSLASGTIIRACRPRARRGPVGAKASTRAACPCGSPSGNLSAAPLTVCRPAPQRSSPSAGDHRFSCTNSINGRITSFSLRCGALAQAVRTSMWL